MIPECLGKTREPRPYHVPVMRDEVLWMLRPRPGGTYLDCTVGGGGHAAAVLEHAGPGAFLVGIDRDPDAIESSRRRLERFAGAFELIHGSYAQLDQALADVGLRCVDGVLFDLGVSSRQFDDARRGFSYMGDGPLDMRMDPGEGPSAGDLVNTLAAEELAKILREYGEEKWASRIARFIVAARTRAPIRTTAQLVDVVKQAIPAGARRSGPHPAKRTFQALRIAVNDELASLASGLRKAMEVLAPGGRLVVISFHSLEDRIVKRKLSEYGHRLRAITVRPLTPCDDELRANPRSRSARLRAAERF